MDPNGSPSPSRRSRIPINSLLNPSGNYESRGVSQLTQRNLESYQPENPLAQGLYPTQRRYHDYQIPPYSTSHYGNRQLEGQSDLSDYARTASAASSPGPPHQRDRLQSASNGSSTPTNERRRPPRPKYQEEEMYFIWYNRVDLGYEWKQVFENFNTQFPDRPRSGFQGIQCKFYRFIQEKKVPTLRDQKHLENKRGGKTSGRKSPGDGSPAYGVVKWTNVWFPWMKEPPPPGYKQPSGYENP